MKIFKHLFFILLVCIIGYSCNSSSILRIGDTGMYPNISDGQYVKIETLKKIETLDYGDIVACYTENYASDGEMKSISRIIGLPNDTIEVIQDKCIVNGSENKYTLIEKDSFSEKSTFTGITYLYDLYEETLPNGKTIQIVISSEREEIIGEKVVVPEGMYYVMGDKRSGAYDSRSYGPIPANKIIGRVKPL